LEDLITETLVQDLFERFEYWGSTEAGVDAGVS